MKFNAASLGARYGRRKSEPSAAEPSLFSQRIAGLNRARMDAGLRQAQDDIGIHERMFSSVEDDMRRMGLSPD